MTLPAERVWAIYTAREFLRSLLDPKLTPGVPKKVREAARSRLKHFPTDLDMRRARDNWDDVFGNQDCESWAEIFGYGVTKK